MLRSEAVALIAARLGNRTDLNNSIITEMKLMQSTLEAGEFIPWFLLTEFSEILGSAGEERIPLPTDFICEYEHGTLWIYDANDTEDPWKELTKDDYDALKAAKTGSARPTHYALVGLNFRVLPVPNAAYTYKMIYYANAQELSSDIENAWLKYAADWLITETGAKIAPYLAMGEAAASFKTDALIAKNRVFKLHEARQHANREYKRGDED